MADCNIPPPASSSIRKERHVKQRVGPISYHLYSLFMNCLLHKKIPEEQVLVEAGMKTSVGDADGANRRQKFLAWSKKMAIRVNPHPVTPEVQVVSLMSKRTNKEIVPKEHFRHLIREIHTRNGKPGQNHLPIHSTVSEIKHKFTFGRRDFGMCEELVRDVINECDALHCYAKIYCKTFKRPETDGICSYPDHLALQLVRQTSDGDPVERAMEEELAAQTAVSSLAASPEKDPAKAVLREIALERLRKPSATAAGLDLSLEKFHTSPPAAKTAGEDDDAAYVTIASQPPHSIASRLKRKLDARDGTGSGPSTAVAGDGRSEAGCSTKTAASAFESDFRETYSRLLICLGSLRQELLRVSCGQPLAYERLCQNLSNTEDLVRACKQELTKCSSPAGDDAA